MDIPDGRFWYVKQQVKSEMLNALRSRIERQHARNRVSGAHIHRLLKYIDPDNPNVLTIGFARRFATYKRATLLMSDLGWLKEIVDHDERPVVFVFAGKAHPADEPGQWLMHEIQRVANLPEFIGKILLVEGYDMDLASLLTSGVDIWLNTPVHPIEASGTSGMKAAINGTVNLSVLDGWWAEGYDGTQRLGHPAGVQQRRRRRARPPGRAHALRDPAGRRHPALLRARREARLLARLGEHLQALDGLDPAALQQRARAARLRLLVLRAGGGPGQRPSRRTTSRRRASSPSGRRGCAPPGPVSALRLANRLPTRWITTAGCSSRSTRS